MSHTRKPALVVAALSMLGPFSVDTYFPSFPAMAAHFGVTEIQMQSTLTFYLVALAGMNLFHGALSDSFGRQRVILTALAVYSVSALACVAAVNFGWLLGLRVLQGLAAGAGMIVSRAVIRDLYEGVHAHRLMAQVTMVGSLAPVIAPILGGWLHVWFGWRGPFFFLSLFGGALWCACRFGLPETLPVHLRHPFHPADLSRAYLKTVRHRGFLLMCVSMACGGGGFLLYVATAPDVVLNILQLSETQFGWMFIPLVTGMVLGSGLTSKLAGRMAPERLVRHGFACMGLAALANIAVNAWMPSRLPWAVMPLAVYTFGFALAIPVITIESLDLVPHRRGLASSLQGFAHIVVFALISSVAAPLVYRSGLKHALGLALLMLGSLAAYVAARRYLSAAARQVPRPLEPGTGADLPG